MITILNTSIVTSYGAFLYQPLTLDGAKELVQPIPCGICSHSSGQIDDGETCRDCGGSGISHVGFESAIGHQSTADILTELLGVEVPLNRINFIQPQNSNAIVFKLKSRVPEGMILGREGIEEIGYEFGLLTRTA